MFNQKSFHQHNFQSDHGGIWDWEKTLIEHAKMKNLLSKSNYTGITKAYARFVLNERYL